MSKAVGLAIMAGGVALAVVIGQRMSTDAMAVIIGVAVGVVASIPTSLLVMAAMRRGQPGYERERQQPYQQPQPPAIYVVTPGALPTQAQAQLPAPAGFYPAERRQYHVVGSGSEPAAERWDEVDE